MDIGVDEHDPRGPEGGGWIMNLPSTTLRSKAEVRQSIALTAQLQRQIPDLSLPLALVAALGEDQQVVDNGPDTGVGPDLEDAGHRSACGYTVVRVLRQRRDVMCDDHPPLDRRPLQNSGVVRSGEPRVLDADDVEVGFPAKQSADDVAVEVLVCREP